MKVTSYEERRYEKDVGCEVERSNEIRREDDDDGLDSDKNNLKRQIQVSRKRKTITNVPKCAEEAEAGPVLPSGKLLRAEEVSGSVWKKCLESCGPFNRSLGGHLGDLGEVEGSFAVPAAQRLDHQRHEGDPIYSA